MIFKWLKVFELGFGGGGGGGSMPDTPDYSNIAKEQAKIDAAARQSTTIANRNKVKTPWGTSNWKQQGGTTNFDQLGYDQAMANYNKQLAAQQAAAAANSNYGRFGIGSMGGMGGVLGGNAVAPGTGLYMPSRADFTTAGEGKWVNEITLPEESQKALEEQQKLQHALSTQAGGMAGRVSDAYKNPFDLSAAPGVDTLDFSKLTAMPDSGFGAVEQVRDAMMARMAPDLLRRRQQEEARMAAQGLGRGSYGEAWGQGQEQLGRNENDMSQQALLGAMGAYGDIFGRGMQARQQGLAEQGANIDAQTAARNRWLYEQQAQRDMPLSELVKLQQAAGQVQMPNFGNQPNPTAGNVQGANMMGAAGQQYAADMGKYNAGQQSNSNMWSGLMGLGSLGLKAFGI